MKKLWSQTLQFLEALHRGNIKNKMQVYTFISLFISLFLIIESYLFTNLGLEPRYILSLLIVLLSAWFGGIGPGIFATLLAGIATYYFLLDPRGSFMIGENFDDLMYLFIFLIEGTLIVMVIELHRKADRKRSEFLGTISHELKNPLTAIKAYAQLISRFAKKKKETTITEFAERIDKQVNHVSEMVNYMLDITKVETGQLIYRDEIFVASDLVKEVVKDQQVITDTHTIHFTSLTDKTVMGDRYRIGQVIINLISNAVKYSPHAKEVIVQVVGKQNGVQISVKDFGIGIREKDRNKMFQPFFRADNVKRAQGTGIGLYISSQIVVRHKGKLWFDSEEGKGSTFYLWLPAATD